jgi:predicted enzyme related to lactoylglutathione lyase
MQAQRVDFIAVPTTDRDRAAAFYEHTLGLTRNPNSTDTWIEFELDNVSLALVKPEQAGQKFAQLPFGSIAIRVPDVEAAKAELEAAGVEFSGEIWDCGVCHGAVFRDSEGNGLLLHRRYAPYRDGRIP